MIESPNPVNSAVPGDHDATGVPETQHVPGQGLRTGSDDRNCPNINSPLESHNQLPDNDLGPLPGDHPPDGWVPFPIAKIFEKRFEAVFLKRSDKSVHACPYVFAQICEGIALHGTIAKALLSTGCPRASYNRWRKEYPDFDAACNEAFELYKEKLEAVADHWACKGENEPVFYKGKVCGTVAKKSARLLELLLKKADPAYRDGGINVNTNVGGVLVVNQPAKTEEEWIQQELNNNGRTPPPLLPSSPIPEGPEQPAADAPPAGPGAEDARP